MLITYLFKNPIFWIIPLAVQIVSYIRILRKMNKRYLLGIVPLFGDYEMSTDLFKWKRSFFRPAVISIVIGLTVLIIGRDTIFGFILSVISLITYGTFLVRLYWRLAKQFGKKRIFAIGMIFLPIVFLPILAFGKSVYLGKRTFKVKQRSLPSRIFRKTAVVLISAVELLVLLAICFGITVIVRPLRPVAELMKEETLQKLESVTDSDEIVGRDVTLGSDADAIIEAQRTRDYYFPDHSSDQKVVVMEYIIGSDLEDKRGFASINISEMQDATKKGSGLDFVIQAGGSRRWFTNGIADESVGRYVISGGKLTKAEMLKSSMSMSEPQNLTDFIVWTKEHYPADRYMLVLWDHGGGFASGYGMDDLNERTDAETSIMTASEIIEAIGAADTKFDLIGFDACLMQNVEYANAFEPYADYYLASEETEPGTGWFYTAGFGKLAENPGLDTREFGKAMISSYDRMNRAANDGDPQRESTLSLVDLTLIKPVYEQLTEVYEKAAQEIPENHATFALLSAGRSKAYEFMDNEQVDLVSFLTSLKNADYEEEVLTDAEIDRIAQTAKACVVYRNSDAAPEINGIAIDFPYSNLGIYTDEHKQLKAVKYSAEQNFFDRFCSIMASQKKAQSDIDEDSFWSFLTLDYSDEEWYVAGFEDYDTASLFIDIPVKETENGFLAELPDKTWDTILDCKVAAYMETEEGYIYIGQEHFAGTDEQGHPVISMDGSWAHVNGHPVCYETLTPLETEEGTVYRGEVKARLNGTDDIVMYVEWDPFTGGSDRGLKGKINGYLPAEEDDETAVASKGLEQFETGDYIEFLFDFYDAEGNLTKTEPYGSRLVIISDNYLSVKDERLPNGTGIRYFGVLTDVYQRELVTEELWTTVEE